MRKRTKSKGVKVIDITKPAKIEESKREPFDKDGNMNPELEKLLKGLGKSEGVRLDKAVQEEEKKKLK